MRRRKTKILPIVIVALVLLAVGYFGHELLTKKAPVAAPADTKPVPTEVTTSGPYNEKNIKDETDAYTIDVTYPELKGWSDKVVMARANKTIKDSIDSLITGFKKDNTPEEGVIVSEQSSLEVNFDKTIVTTEKTTTVIFSVSDYFGGAAHPNSYEHPITVANSSGLLLSTKDFFKTDSNYLSILSTKATAILKKRLGSDFSAEGALPKAENYDTLYLTKTSLVILFNPYQVAAYAMGVVKVEIPKSELQAILK